MRNELDAFISYSRIDADFVGELARELIALGKTPWIDTDEIGPGAPWREELGTAIEAAVMFVFIVSPESVRSSECLLELARAVELGKRLLPVVLREAPMPDALAAIQWVTAGTTSETAAAIAAAIDTDYDWARAHTQWLARALRWEAATNASMLPRGDELRSAEDWLGRQAEGHDPRPTELQTRFIAAARQRERGVLRRIAIVSTGALVVIAALAVVTFIARRVAVDQRDQARSRTFAASAIGSIETDPVAGLALAVRANEIDETPESIAAVRQALLASRLREVMRAQTTPLIEAAFSARGDLVATGDTKGGVRLWRDHAARALPGLSSTVRLLAFDPGGEWLVGVDAAGDGRVWRTSDGAARSTFRTDATVSDASTNRRVDTLVAVTPAGAQTWRLPSGAPIRTLGASADKLRVAAVSQDARHVLTGGDDGTVRWWNVSRGTQDVVGRHTEARRDLGDGIAIPGRATPIGNVAFSPDGKLALSSAFDGAVDVYDRSGRTLASFPGGATAAFTPDSRWVVAGSSDNGSVVVSRARTGQTVLTLPGRGSGVGEIAFSPDSRLVATEWFDGTTHVWGREDGRVLAVLKAPGLIRDLEFAPDNRRVLTADVTGAARIWDSTSMVPIRVAPGQELLGASLGAGGSHVLTTAGAASLELWDSRTGRPAYGDHCAGRVDFSCLTRGYYDAFTDLSSTEAVFDNTLAAAALAPRTNRVATISDGGILQQWDPRTGVPQSRAVQLAAVYADVVYSPDGKLLVAAAGRAAQVFDVRSGAVRRTLRVPKNVTGVTFADGGALVVAATEDGNVRVWRMADGRQAASHRFSKTLIYDVDGGSGGMIAVTDGQTVQLWDSRSRAAPLRLSGQPGEISAVAVSPDGQFVSAAGSADAVRVWESRTGRYVASFGGHGGEVVSLGFSPDGHRLLTGSADGVARVFDCDPCAPVAALMKLARGRVATQLTPGERDRVLRAAGD